MGFQYNLVTSSIPVRESSAIFLFAIAASTIAIAPSFLILLSVERVDQVTDPMAFEGEFHTR